MSNESTGLASPNWRLELPTLTARLVTLREAATSSGSAPRLMDLLLAWPTPRVSASTSSVSELVSVQQLLDRIAARSRGRHGASPICITISSTRAVAGLIQARQIDLSWESGEWECTLAPSWRGTGIFLEAARLIGSFAFGTVGVHRLEARVLLQNGRANGALRKLGAVQEGVLRDSVRRGIDYLDQVLWSVLKEDWGEHWVSTAPRVH